MGSSDKKSSPQPQVQVQSPYGAPPPPYQPHDQGSGQPQQIYNSPYQPQQGNGYGRPQQMYNSPYPPQGHIFGQPQQMYNTPYQPEHGYGGYPQQMYNSPYQQPQQPPPAQQQAPQTLTLNFSEKHFQRKKGVASDSKTGNPVYNFSKSTSLMSLNDQIEVSRVGTGTIATVEVDDLGSIKISINGTKMSGKKFLDKKKGTFQTFSGNTLRWSNNINCMDNNNNILAVYERRSEENSKKPALIIYQLGFQDMDSIVLSAMIMENKIDNDTATSVVAEVIGAVGGI